MSHYYLRDVLLVKRGISIDRVYIYIILRKTRRKNEGKKTRKINFLFCVWGGGGEKCILRSQEEEKYKIQI